MKKYVVFFLMLGLLASCNKYDDSELWDAVNGIDTRLSALEKTCKEMNVNISALQTIVDVLETNDYVTNVTAVMEDGVEIGYKIDFNVHSSITIYHGKDGEKGEPGEKGESGEKGEKGEQGENGLTPYINEDGYWCVGDSNTGIKAEGTPGATPQIINGYWYIGNENTGVLAKGTNGISPVIGVKQDTDGKYYWTQSWGTGNLSWIYDDNNNKIPVYPEGGGQGQAGETPYIGSNGNWWIGTSDTGVQAAGQDGKPGDDGETPYIGTDGNWWIGSTNTGVKAAGKDGEDGITPQLKIENDHWMLSVDNGLTWKDMGQAKGDKGDSGTPFFTNVINEGNNLVIELQNGTVISLPKKQAFSLTLAQTQVPNVQPLTTYEIAYSIEGEGGKETNIETIAPTDWKVVIQRTNNLSGKIVVTTPYTVSDGKVLVLLSDGTGSTIMQTVAFTKGNLSVDQTEYTLESGGGTITVKVTTDIDYTVNIATEDQAWISCTTNPLDLSQFTLAIAANPNTAYRYATVELLAESGFVLERIYISQKSAATRVIDVSTPGTLESLISIDELNTYENIKITGQLNIFDYNYLKEATALKSVDLSDLDAVTLPASAFSESLLQEVILPKQLQVIPSRAFYKSAITSITIPETVTEIGEYAFAECQQAQGDVVIPNSVKTIGQYVFYKSSFNGSLTLSFQLTEIPRYAFAGSAFTGTLAIPDNVQSIREYAFSSATEFERLILNEDLLSIGRNAFSYCIGLSGNLTIPDKVLEVGESAFHACSKFKGSLIIGKAVSSIGELAFAYNVKGANEAPLYFNKIYFKGTEPPANLCEAFHNGLEDRTLPYVGVPFGCKEIYQAAFDRYYHLKITVLEEVEF